MRRARGFTLIELIFATVIISVGLVGVAKIAGNTNNALVLSEETNKAARFAQECAERILRTHRNTLSSTLASALGFLSNADTTNNLLCTSPAGFTTTVTLSSTFDNSDNSRCPAILGLSILCGDVRVRVQSNTNPSASSSIVFMMVQ